MCNADLKPQLQSDLDINPHNKNISSENKF